MAARAYRAYRGPREVLHEYEEEYIPHGLVDDPPNYVEINWRTVCGCSHNIVIDDSVRQKRGEERLYKCTNPDTTHFFIKTRIRRDRRDIDVYKYDNFYMEQNIGGMIHKYIPFMNNIDFPHTDRKNCRNNSLQFYNKATNTFQTLIRYIPSGYKVPILFREYLKQLRKNVGRDFSSELYVVGLQYRTYPFDIQLGVTETLKHGRYGYTYGLEPNNHARRRAKSEELQIENRALVKNKYMGKMIQTRERRSSIVEQITKWYIRFLNQANYDQINPMLNQINQRGNNRDKRKIGILIVGTIEELTPLCRNFSATSINSRNDAIARPIIIKLDHILKRAHSDKWFRADDTFNINQNALRGRNQVNQISTIIESLQLEDNPRIRNRMEPLNTTGSKSGSASNRI